MRPSLLGLAFLAALSAHAAPEERLQEAMARTARGDLPGAESLYRALAADDPESGLPALARFLALTAPADTVNSFLGTMARDGSLPIPLRARIFLHADRETEAADLLLPTARLPDAPSDLLLFTADVLERAGQLPDAVSLLLRALDQASSPESAREPLRRLLPHAALLANGTPDLAPVRRFLLAVDLPAEDRLVFLDELFARGAFPGPHAGEDPFGRLLASLILGQSGQPEAALTALPEPTDAEPDLLALQRLRLLARLGRTEESAPVARRLLGLPEAPPQGTTAAPEPIPWTEAEAEARFLACPFDPEPLRFLIRLRAQAGATENEIAAIPARVGDQATNPFLLGHCGYVLATEGFPGIALSYHDRALAREPGDPFLTLNRAACLTRLGRWDEAAGIYQTLLIHGHAGRPYHVHELILRLWQIAEHQGTEATCQDTLARLAQDPSIPWHDLIAQEATALFARVNP